MLMAEQHPRRLQTLHGAVVQPAAGAAATRRPSRFLMPRPEPLVDPWLRRFYVRRVAVTTIGPSATVSVVTPFAVANLIRTALAPAGWNARSPR